MQIDPNTPTGTTAVALPPTLTEPLPADADTVTVAARTAAVAAHGVSGVHHLGGFAARAADQVRARLGRSASTAGVQVDDQDGRLDVRVAVVVEYPHPVHEVADTVRTQVRHALDQLPDAAPAQVDVTVIDVHGPFDDEPTPVSRAADAVGDAAARARDTASDAAGKVRDASADAAGKVREAAATVRDASSDAADATRATATDLAGRARDAASAAADSARDAAANASQAVQDAAGAARTTTDAAATRAADAAASAGSTAADAASRAGSAGREAAAAAAEAVRSVGAHDDDRDAATDAEAEGVTGPVAGTPAVVPAPEAPAADALEDAAASVQRAADAVRADAEGDEPSTAPEETRGGSEARP